MKLQNLTVIFIVIILPIILLVSLYINTGIKTIKYQALYDTGLLNATHDAIYAFEINSAKNIYSSNAETKRSIIKSSIKMFETSLANTCNISSYSANEIEEYIPAIVFGMYDGFYMYAPSYNSITGKYEHSLKNYVYYSETLEDGTVIRYSLDNYVSVTVKINSEYIIREGYLIDIDGTEANGTKYKEIDIDVSDTDAVNYYKDAYEFTDWFLKTAKIQDKKKNGTSVTYLNIGNSNDPEDPNSAFVKHKREIIRKKIEGVLNSTITAYSNKTWGQNYKMPKLSEYDWEKIYNNISVTSFFQGKKIGLTKYNGYCVLNSTNSSEYVNPSLMYFIYDNEYHDIRCGAIADIKSYINGYRIGSFEKKTIEDDDGTQKYQYEHDELACYNCINGALSTSTSVYDYIKSNGGTATPGIKTSYWTSLARERYKMMNAISVNTDLDSTTESDPTPAPTPEPTPDLTPDPIPDQTPDLTPDPTPDPIPDQTPDLTLDPTPEPTPDPTPDPTPEPTPDPTPDPIPDQTPDLTPDPTPDQTPKVQDAYYDSDNKIIYVYVSNPNQITSITIKRNAFTRDMTTCNKINGNITYNYKYEFKTLLNISGDYYTITIIDKNGNKIGDGYTNKIP